MTGKKNDLLHKCSCFERKLQTGTFPFSEKSEALKNISDDFIPKLSSIFFLPILCSWICLSNSSLENVSVPVCHIKLMAIIISI